MNRGRTGDEVRRQAAETLEEEGVRLPCPPPPEVRAAAEGLERAPGRTRPADDTPPGRSCERNSRAVRASEHSRHRKGWRAAARHSGVRRFPCPSGEREEPPSPLVAASRSTLFTGTARQRCNSQVPRGPSRTAGRLDKGRRPDCGHHHGRSRTTPAVVRRAGPRHVDIRVHGYPLRAAARVRVRVFLPPLRSDFTALLHRGAGRTATAPEPGPPGCFPPGRGGRHAEWSV